MTHRSFSILLALALGLVAPGTSVADEASPPASNPFERAANEPWRFAINIWGWLPSAPAKIDQGPISEELPEDLGKILDSLQWGAFLDLEARKGPFGVYATPIIIGLDDTEHVEGPIQRHEIDISEEVLLMDFGLSYQFGPWDFGSGADAPQVALEPFVGARWLYDDLGIDLDPGPSNDIDVHFIAPVVGLNMFWDLTEHWVLRFSGDYGGFDVDHLKYTFNLLGVVGYRFDLGGVDTHVFAGGRYLYIDYEKTASLEVAIRGPILGIGFAF
jgi:hypothetical protein